jgi:hypothetical protein
MPSWGGGPNTVPSALRSHSDLSLCQQTISLVHDRLLGLYCEGRRTIFASVPGVLRGKKQGRWSSFMSL